MPPHQIERLEHTSSLILGPEASSSEGLGNGSVPGAGGQGFGSAASSHLHPAPSPGKPSVKCVLVGDGSIGKTSMVVSYTTNGYPTEYLPTAFDNYSVMVTVDSKPVQLQLCDTAGQDDFDSLRPLCYPNTDVFLVCFSVVSPTSFYNLTDKWLPELRASCPDTPILLVGTQCDLRNDVKELIELNKYNEKPVTDAEARLKAQEIGALLYVECSALTQKNLKEVFDSAILAALDIKGLIEESHGKKRSKKYKCNSELWYNGNHGNSPSCSASHAAKSDRKPQKGWRKFCCFQ